MADATSFLLPTEPFEVLMRTLHSLNLAPPEDRWATPSEHVRYFRSVFHPSHPQDLPTEKCWLEDDRCTFLQRIYTRVLTGPTVYAHQM